MLCNGLGTNPYMWPALLRPDCGVRIVSWNHRGVGGSERPADPSHVEIEHFVEDGLSVMDHFGIDRAVLMGWSIGVNTMFEMAYRTPSGWPACSPSPACQETRSPRCSPPSGAPRRGPRPHGER